jgi:flagellar biogenesis protein FliO
LNALLLIKILIFLAFVIVVIYFCFLLVQKRLITKARQHGERIRIIEHKYLDQKLTVSLIAIDSVHLVIAAGQNGIALTRLEKPYE